MATATQQHRSLKVTSPLGPDVLLPQSFSGQESLSRLFRFELNMVSSNPNIGAADILGKPIGFSVEGGAPGRPPRHFHGIVSRFHGGGMESGPRVYYAEVVPWLWFLTKTSDCRVFQNKDVKEILQQIFGDFGFSDFEIDQVKGNHAKREYCVQYNETYFDFVSRLMEEEGIFYFFRHEQSKHTLVLADNNGVHQKCPDGELEHEYSFTSSQRVPRLTSWNHSYEFITGKWAQTDYNFENPSRTNKTPAKILETNESTVVQLPGASKYEQFEYPGGYLVKGDGQSLTKRRMTEEEHTFDVVTATSGVSSLSCGGKFSIAKHPVQSEIGKSWVISEISHQATEPASYTGGLPSGGGEVYSNSMKLISANTTFHPPRVTEKPRIYGSQTAVVTGPAGEEIWPDKYGRVLIQFFWDRRGVRDEKTSCFVRVAQSSAGKGWGAMFLPRIGQEVVVTYLDGDPDRPLITGVVYNAEQMPAYELPANKTRSYVKTNTTQGGEGYNEIRFEDKKDEEQIFVHAQRNMDLRVRNDQMTNVVGHRHTTIGHEKDGEKVGDDKLLVWGNKETHVKGAYTITPEGDLITTIGTDEENLSSWYAYVKNMHILTVEKEGFHSFGSRATKIQADESLTVGGDRHEKIGMGWSHESGMNVYIKAGMNLVLEAGLQLTLKVGGNFIDINPAGVFIQGTMLNLNSGGAPGAGSPPTPAEARTTLPVELEEPKKADDSKTGKKSVPDSLS